MRSQRVAGQSINHHCVGAFAGQFCDHVASLIHDVGVVAGAARERICTNSAVEKVIAIHARQAVTRLIADQHVAKCVTGQVG